MFLNDRILSFLCRGLAPVLGAQSRPAARHGRSLPCTQPISSRCVGESIFIDLCHPGSTGDPREGTWRTSLSNGELSCQMKEFVVAFQPASVTAKHV